MFKSAASVLTPIHREGFRFIAIFLGASLLLFAIGLAPLGWLGLVLTAWCAYFFRDPERMVPEESGLVVAPADGRICAIETVSPPDELSLGVVECQRISIFMNVFDVHINRSPLSAKVLRIAYVPGKFLSADLDKASKDNERQAMTLESPEGHRLGVIQIAGLIARRIVTFVKEGRDLRAGEKFGLIRFGSRVDLYLPQGAKALVAVGQRAIAGETILADLSQPEGRRSFRRS